MLPRLTVTGRVAVTNEEKKMFCVFIWRDIDELVVSPSLRIDAIMRNSVDTRGKPQCLPSEDSIVSFTATVTFVLVGMISVMVDNIGYVDSM